MTVEPTPGAAARPCRDPRYGAHPAAHPAVSRYARQIAEILEAASPAEVPGRAAQALGALLGTPDLLAEALRAGDETRYRKHVLYADPGHRFTLLSIVWRPGQTTVVHGHRAWGAMGVYEGRPEVTLYDCRELPDGTHHVEPRRTLQGRPGTTSIVRPGLEDVHLVRNPGEETAITLHTYGCDLVRDPDSINLGLRLPDANG
jgi:predicted metal-dependent enzyme (double-stranded beta helix superfamily)